MRSNETDTRVWRIYGHLGLGTEYAGMSCFNGSGTLPTLEWNRATCDGFWMAVNYTGNHEYLAYGLLWIGNHAADVTCIDGTFVIDADHSLFATKIVCFLYE